MTSGTAVIITRVAAVEPITCGEMVSAEFGDEVAALSHFRVNTSKDVPVDGMECAIIPVETILIVENESGQSGMGTDGSFKAAGHCSSIDGKHHSAFGVEGNMVEGGGVFF